MVMSRSLRLGLAALAVFLVLVAIGSRMSEPTEGTFSVTVRNGLHEPVMVGLCSTPTCRHTVDSTTLTPGETFSQNVEVNVRTPFRVQTRSGVLLGCWNLVVPNRDTRVATLRTLRHCPAG
jgi:hypothetical protein